MRLLLYLAGFVLPLSALAVDGVVRLPVKHNRKAVSKRDAGPVSISLANAQVEYLVEIEVGTPPQKIQSQLDTGSSDLWFPTASQCPSTDMCPYGFFTPSSSSTFVDVSPGDFNISYGDGSAVVGDYFTDTITIEGATLKKFTMAVAKDVTGEGVINSVFGVSFSTLEASQSGSYYHNYPIALVDQGVTETVAYSLWLDDLTANTGSILFSGLDKSKFCGDLTIVDVQDYEKLSAFWVTLSSVSFTTSSSTSTVSSGSALALLDSGTSLTALPQDVLATVVAFFPSAKYDHQQGVYFVDCSEGQKTAHFTFNFGTTSITVGLNEFVLNQQGACILGFQLTPEAGSYILGDTFLRSVYAVYDLVNKQIGIAQSSFNSGSSDVVPFPSYGAHIPQVSGDSCGGGSTTTTTSATATATTSSGSTATGTTTATNPSGSGSATGTIITTTITSTAPGGGSGGQTTVITLTQTTSECPSATTVIPTIIPPPSYSPGSTGHAPPPPPPPVSSSSSAPGGGNGGGSSTTSGPAPPLFTNGAASLAGSSYPVAAVLAVGVALVL